MSDEEAAMPRGALVVVEGLDRAGKSSQCHLLRQHLESQGCPVRYQKFPDRSTTTGQMINSYLTGQVHIPDHSIHLLFSANRWEAVDSILSDLRHGTTVIVDRYSYSGAVYSAAKDNPDLSLGWAWCMEVGLPKPDVVIFLHISPQEAASRDGFGEERYETTKMQSRVRELFGVLFQNLVDSNLHTIEATGSAEEVAKLVLQAVLPSLTSTASTRPIGKLEGLSG